MESKVRIESKGNAHDTTVYVNGEPVDSVVEATWTCKAGEVAMATITFDRVEVDVQGVKVDA